MAWASAGTSDRRAPCGEARVLVVGCGFIGRHAAVGLAAAGRPVSVLSRREPPDDVSLTADVHVGDAGDGALAGALAGVRHVVWCAGGLLPPEAEADPEADAALTLAPLRRLIAHAEHVPGLSITYLASGGTVYGNPAATPVAEDAPTTPIGAYGRTRLAAERLLLDAHAAGRLRARVLRCANVYGAHQPANRSQGAVAVFVDRVRRGEEIVLFGGGAAVRDFVHVSDVVHVVDALIDRGGPPLLNVGSGRGTTVRELLHAVERALGERALVREEPARDFDVDRIVLDVARLRSLMPYEPLALADGLARTVEAREPVPVGALP